MEDAVMRSRTLIHGVLVGLAAAPLAFADTRVELGNAPPASASNATAATAANSNMRPSAPLGVPATGAPLPAGAAPSGAFTPNVAQSVAQPTPAAVPGPLIFRQGSGS